MRKLFYTLSLMLAAGLSLFGQSGYHLRMLGHWDDNSLPIASPDVLKLQYSGCWGIAADGREYAVLGGAEHVLFFDVTIPDKPRLVGKFAGTANTVWREFKSYKDRVYAVSDRAGEGLMIFDMRHARDSIVRRYWSTEHVVDAHTITLDTVSGRIYLNGGSAVNGVIVLDVSQDPDRPQFLAHANFNVAKVHDSYVRHDTLYASAGFDGLMIFDMGDPLQPKLLAQIGTGGYNHNNWVNRAGTYAYYTEEVPTGRPIQIVDLALLPENDLELAGSFLDKFANDSVITSSNGNVTYTSAIPHNVYLRDNLLFDSQYEDGLLVYDVSDPVAPKLLDRYDTYPENTAYNQFKGNWGNYPWLPSGNIISSDMQHGLFVFRLEKTEEPAEKSLLQLRPNPFHEQFEVWLPFAGQWHWQLYNVAGQLLREGDANGTHRFTVQTGPLPKGVYIIRFLEAGGQRLIRKLVTGN